MTPCTECGKLTDDDMVDADGACGECHEIIADLISRLPEDDQ